MLNVVFGGDNPNGRASLNNGRGVPAVDGSRNGEAPGQAKSDGEEAKLLNQAFAESGLGILAKVDATGSIVQANEEVELVTGLTFVLALYRSCGRGSGRPDCFRTDK